MDNDQVFICMLPWYKKILSRFYWATLFKKDKGDEAVFYEMEIEKGSEIDILINGIDKEL